jgi:hypothetical protein
MQAGRNSDAGKRLMTKRVATVTKRGFPMPPFSSAPGRSSRATLAGIAVSLLALALIPVATGRSDAALSVHSVQPLTRGKPLVSGRLNTVPVSYPFGFAVSLRNARADRAVLVKVTVRYKRNRQAPLVLKTTATADRGIVIVHDALRGGGMVLFAIPAQLTVAVTDRAAHVTATRQYAVIFSLA